MNITAKSVMFLITKLGCASKLANWDILHPDFGKENGTPHTLC